MRTKREQILILVMSVVAAAGGFASCAIDCAVWPAFIIVSVWASGKAMEWKERSWRLEAEDRAEAAERLTVAIAVAALRGDTVTIYSDECDCPACTAVRAARRGKDALPS